MNRTFVEYHEEEEKIRYNSLVGRLLYRSATGHFVQGHANNSGSIFCESNTIVGIITSVVADVNNKEIIVNYLLRGKEHELYISRECVKTFLSESGWLIDDGAAGTQLIMVI